MQWVHIKPQPQKKKTSSSAENLIADFLLRGVLVIKYMIKEAATKVEA